VVNLIWDIIEAVKSALEAWSSLSIVADIVAFLNNDISINIYGFQFDLLESPLDIILSPATWLLFVSLGLVKTFIPAA
jgi:hypothetical protein